MAKILHQFTESLAIGDATSEQVLLIQRWLREAGWESDIFSIHYEDKVADLVRPARSYKRSGDETHLIYHHATGADVVTQLQAINLPLLLVYHNVTPPELMSGADPRMLQQLIRGRDQLVEIAPQTTLGLGASEYNRQELMTLGFAETGVLPIVLDTTVYPAADNPAIVEQLGSHRPNLLFVSRVVPSKGQDDIIKLLYYLRRFQPEAHLTIVGSLHLPGYLMWLKEMIKSLELQDAVTITGHIPFMDVVTYYRNADVLVSMSEHEGFGKFLIEAMHFELPILAYSAAAVPMTLGDCGVQFREKSFEVLAEAADMLAARSPFRDAIIAGQKRRLVAFTEPTVRQQFWGYLAQIGIADQEQS